MSLRRGRALLLIVIGALLLPGALRAAERAGMAVSPSDWPRVTPGELLIRVEDGRDLRQDAAFRRLTAQWDILSARRVLRPRPGAPVLRRALERTWVLRFAEDVPLGRAKAEVERLPFVAWAAPNRLFRTLDAEVIPNDPSYPDLWNLPAIGMPEAWAIERGNPSVIVAVIDTGADMEHPDLREQLWTNPKEIPGNGRDDDGNGFVDDVHGWDFVDAPTAPGRGDFQTPDADPTDESGHGTHVAGIVAAQPNNDLGIAGVAWGCRLMVVRAGFTGREGGTLLQEDDSAAAIVYAAENGAAVINMSWGDERGSFLLRDTVRYAASLDVVLVGAAGNESRPTIVYPAAFPEVISVAASDQNHEAAYFTNGNAEIDVAAPGIVILSLDIDGGLRTLSGTSMAAPHVAGVAALMRAKRPSLTAEEVGRLIRTTANPLAAEGRAVGAGELNAPGALRASESLIAEIDTTALRLGADRRLDLRGRVGGRGYVGYRLLMGESETPTHWTPLFETREIGRSGADRLLYTWNTASLAEGVYTIRLEAFDDAGGIARDQRLVQIDHTPPEIVEREVFFAIRGGAEVSTLHIATDDLVFGTLSFRNLLTGTTVGPIRYGVPRSQFFLVLPDELPFGEWEYEFHGRNLAGMETAVRGRAESAERTPNPGRRSPLEGRALPSLDVARRTADFDGDGQPEIIGATPGGTGFLVTQVYEYVGSGRFRAVHHLRSFLTPLDVGDLDGDGLLEVLGQQGNDLILMEARRPGSFPTEEIWREAGLRNGRFVDVDGDGQLEVLARRGASTVALYRATANDTFREVAALRNPTEGRNLLASTFATGDFDGDGNMDLIVGDSDGDLLRLAWSGSDFRPRWETRTPYTSIRALASGTFNGQPGIVLAAERVYGPGPRAGRFLVIAILQWDAAAGGFRPIARGVRRFLMEDDGVAVVAGRMDATEDDAIGVVVEGRAYLLKATRDGLNLDWTVPATRTEHPAFLDLTGDGRDEFLFNGAGVLRIITPASAPDAATRPYQLRAEAIDRGHVRLTWRSPDPGAPVDVYRATNRESEMRRLASLPGGTESTREYVDDSVRVGNTYRYAVGRDDALSDPATVIVAEQPALRAAEALTESRVRIRFDLPMGRSARRSDAYVIRNAIGPMEGRVPTSVVRVGSSGELLLSLLEPLPAGRYVVEVVDPTRIRSADGMPVDPAGASASFEVGVDGVSVEDLSRFRVFPNPVYPNRNHPARVTFDALPVGTRIRIFTADGRLVVSGAPQIGRSEWTWDLLNDRLQPVAGGVYVYVVEWRGMRRMGKVAVIR